MKKLILVVAALCSFASISLAATTNEFTCRKESVRFIDAVSVLKLSVTKNAWICLPNGSYNIQAIDNVSFTADVTGKEAEIELKPGSYVVTRNN